MTDHNNGGPATANMTPMQVLEAYDSFMIGAGPTPEGRAVSKSVALAAVFGVEAYEKAIDSNQGAHAMARSFLLALADPLHPDLDYLRIDPASGAVERAAREVQP
jgi:hypothetical protein